MGARAQVLIKDTGVYLYTHWGSGDIGATVQRALSRRQRWTDPGYLARIIFSEMIQKDIHGETGYGIDNIEHGDIDKLVTIDTKNKTVQISGPDGIGRQWTFDEFINDDTEDVDKIGESKKAVEGVDTTRTALRIL